MCRVHRGASGPDWAPMRPRCSRRVAAGAGGARARVTGRGATKRARGRGARGAARHYVRLRASAAPRPGHWRSHAAAGGLRALARVRRRRRACRLCLQTAGSQAGVGCGTGPRILDSGLVTWVQVVETVTHQGETSSHIGRIRRRETGSTRAVGRPGKFRVGRATFDPAVGHGFSCSDRYALAAGRRCARGAVVRPSPNSVDGVGAPGGLGLRYAEASRALDNPHRRNDRARSR